MRCEFFTFSVRCCEKDAAYLLLVHKELVPCKAVLARLWVRGQDAYAYSDDFDEFD
jgi:hypothetical protein